MSSSLMLFLIGILPLLAFVIVDSFSSMKIAIISALAVGLLEFTLSLYFTGGFDWISFAVFILLIAMGTVSIKMNTPISFKLQPVVVSLLFAILLLGSSFFGNPMFVALYEKYKHVEAVNDSFLPMINAFGLENFLRILTIWSWATGYGFLIHAILMLWAALKLSKWWWIVFKGIGVYVVIIIINMLAIRIFF